MPVIAPTSVRPTLPPAQRHGASCTKICNPTRRQAPCELKERWRHGRQVESELEITAFRIWSLAEVQLALAAAGFVEVSAGADHRPGRRPGRNSRILNFEARRPAS